MKSMVNRLYNEELNQVKTSLIKKTIFNRYLVVKDADMKQ